MYEMIQHCLEILKKKRTVIRSVATLICNIFSTVARNT